MNKKDNSSIVRKLKDFEWMKAKLFDLFPGIFLPPIGPSASEVNQINRIKLMLSKAFKNMNNNDNEMTYIDLNKYKVSKTKEREEEVLAKC